MTQRATAGQTYPRAPILPGSELESIVKKYGENSIEAIRAMAKAGPDQYNQDEMNCFWNAPSSNFLLRIGPDYNKNRQKAPSPYALYDMYAMDIFHHDQVLKNASDMFEIPTVPGITDIPRKHPHIPHFIIINNWVESDTPSLTTIKSNGPSYMFVCYAIISQTAFEQLDDFENKASPALKLWADWCQHAQDDIDVRAKLKLLMKLEDMERLGLPNFMNSWNGKPALIRKTTTIFHHPTYMEITNNMREWRYAARKAFHYLIPKARTFVINLGFTVEARSEDELPEILLFGLRGMKAVIEKELPKWLQEGQGSDANDEIQSKNEIYRDPSSVSENFASVFYDCMDIDDSCYDAASTRFEIRLEDIEDALEESQVNQKHDVETDQHNKNRKSSMFKNVGKLFKGKKNKNKEKI